MGLARPSFTPTRRVRRRGWDSRATRGGVMAKSPHEQQKTDATRIPDGGTGKLDHSDVPAAPEPIRRESADQPNDGGPHLDPALVESLQEQVARDRDAAVAELQVMGISPRTDEAAPRAGVDAVLDEGDAAQASERTDMSFATRERLAERINRLTAALERIAQGRYGTCAMCGRPVEAARLRAIPE